MAMAYILPDATGYTVRPWMHTSVWLRRLWSQDWTWIPYAKTLWAEERAAPVISAAQFQFDFGRILQVDRDWDVYAPLLASECYVRFVIHSYWGQYLAWAGVVKHEQTPTDGTLAWPQGEQTFTAFGLEQLLDRQEMVLSWTDGGWVDRPLTYNRLDVRGLSTMGNRSASADPVTGAHRFSADGYVWSNLDIVRHILAYHVQGITFDVVGVTDALDQIYEEHDLYGLKPKDALDCLIDRKRGFGWRVIPTDVTNGTIYIHVFSTLAEPMTLGTYSMPANEDRCWFYPEAKHEVAPVFRFNNLTRYDKLVVVGGPVRTCFSTSYTDGNIEPGWTEDEKTTYMAGTGTPEDAATEHDAARQAESLNNVFQKFRIPDDWDGFAGDGIGGVQSAALPSTGIDGGVYPQVPMTYSPRPGVQFDREIPLAASVLLDAAATDYVRPSVIVKIPGSDVYDYVDKVRINEGPSASVHVSDKELAIFVEASGGNHVAALDDWEAGSPAASEVDAMYNWQDYIFTMSFPTDAHLVVEVRIPTNVVVDVPTVKTLVVPDAEAWYIVPNTTVDTYNGTELAAYGGPYFPAADGNLERWDGERLRAIALLAASYYGRAKATVGVLFKDVRAEWSVGTMMMGAVGNWHAVELGTVVTYRRWDFREQTTTIQTGFEELHFEKVA